VTSTDKNGNFKAPLRQKGSYKMKVDGKEIPFEYKGGALSAIKVDVAAGKVEMGATGQAASSGRKTKVTKGSLDGLETTQPTAKETADTAGAIRGKPAPPPPKKKRR
jgi:hypothetical protein